MPCITLRKLRSGSAWACVRTVNKRAIYCQTRIDKAYVLTSCKLNIYSQFLTVSLRVRAKVACILANITLEILCVLCVYSHCTVQRHIATAFGCVYIRGKYCSFTLCIVGVHYWFIFWRYGTRWYFRCIYCSFTPSWCRRMRSPGAMAGSSPRPALSSSGALVGSPSPACSIYEWNKIQMYLLYVSFIFITMNVGTNIDCCTKTMTQRQQIEAV